MLLQMNDLPAILLAEDREDDILLIQKAFEKGGIRNPLFIVHDGEEAMNYLSGLGHYSNRTQYPLPALFLLDLKMPGTDGFDVLGWISTQSYLKSLRTVVLTSSDRIRDADAAYKLGATSFLMKPLDFYDTVELAKNMIHYWLKMNVSSGPSAVAQPKAELTKATVENV